MATGSVEPQTTSASPTSASAAKIRTVSTRPWLSIRPGPNQRPSVIAARKMANVSAPSAAAAP